ncbi:MAG: ABC transporter substrate-binding protein [Cyanobium sp. MAG06]|nr:ABC transporter substrate-binding protein [Cyanobium sp. MAG06]
MKNIIIKNIKLLSLILIAVVIIVIILFINNNKDVNSVSNNNNVKVLDKSPVNIGFVGPILDNKYDYGLSTLKVLDIMAISINNAGGINGRPIHLIAEDGACDGEKAKFATDKLIREYKVKYIIGGICSGESLSMIDSINKNKVILMSPISTSAKLTNSSPYFFRNIVSDAYTAKSIADYIYNKDKSNKTLYVLSENTEYTRDFQEILSKAYTDKGGKIISTLDIDNFVSILKNIDTDKIKSIYINYQSTE